MISNQNMTILDNLPYLQDLKSLYPSNQRFEIQGSGPVGHSNEDHDLVKVRNFTSHQFNENCLIFCFENCHLERIEKASSNQKKYIYKNCIFVIEETSKLDWWEYQFDGRLILENCTFYKCQDYVYRMNNQLKINLSYAVPWAICAGNRLLIFLLKYGLKSQIKSITGSPFCWVTKRYEQNKDVVGSEKVITLESNSGKIVNSHEDYIAGYIFLKAMTAYQQLVFEYISPLDAFTPGHLLQLINIDKINIPSDFELYSNSVIKYHPIKEGELLLIDKYDGDKKSTEVIERFHISSK